MKTDKERRRRWFSRNLCPYAIRQHDGSCLGYAKESQDEPCEICKECRKVASKEDDYR